MPRPLARVKGRAVLTGVAGAPKLDSVGRLALWGVLVALCALCLGAGDPTSWRARRRRGVTPNRRAAELVLADQWPAEPASPPTVDAGEFARALRMLCGYMPKGRPERYADWILREAEKRDEDPFLIAALVYRMSRCKPDAETSEGVGLAGIQARMFRGNARGRHFEYLVPIADGGVTPRKQTLSRMLTDVTMKHAEAALEWTGALLEMYRLQHAIVDAQFEQVPHRHHVSHFVWGDSVDSARAEDRIFTDRRRLLTYYGVKLPVPTQRWRDIAFRPPLDGGLRVISSVPGDDRDGGERAHRGVDVESSFGEPVYAMAAGRVSFAGVDLPGRGSQALSPREIGSVPRRELGRGGRFVCVRHASAGERWLRSCYMHLEATAVSTGDEVVAGQRLGTVGRTGMRSSAPHLHLELQSEEGIFNAREVLDALFLGEF